MPWPSPNGGKLLHGLPGYPCIQRDRDLKHEAIQNAPLEKSHSLNDGLLSLGKKSEFDPLLSRTLSYLATEMARL
jgi:hypothetical protein